MRDVPTDLVDRLKRHGQQHVLFGWENLSPSERHELIRQLAGIDLALLDTLYAARDKTEALPDRSRIKPFETEPIDQSNSEAIARGEAALRAGEVAVLVVAGGQGTRLGFDKPKGLFPITPVTGKSLFQVHAEKVVALSRRYGKPIPFLVMTSPATHAETAAFFAEHRLFGLRTDQVIFFQQGTMPALDPATGKMILEKPGRIFLSPNGHGGTLTALAETGLLDDLRSGGYRHLFYFQVDNPLVQIADPVFLGRHLLGRADVSSKVITKEEPSEKLGLFVRIDGKCGMIEYSDLPSDLAEERRPDGTLAYDAGNPAIHIFDLDFLARITQSASSLPFHIARKKVSGIDAAGKPLTPTTENALKFEMFIFDALPLAERALGIRTSRRIEFAPLKNADGKDSPATVRLQQSNLFADWLAQAGVMVPRSATGDALFPIEIAPGWALDAAELSARLQGTGLLLS